MKTIRVAITGLKRSGKSVFITSLVNQLLNRKDDSMQDFPEKKKNWHIYAELLPLPKGLSRFPYEDNLNALNQDHPEWPCPTTVLSEIHLKFSYRKSTNNPLKTFKLEIVDYPGEWLPDLQMLNLPFHEWSRLMISRAKEKTRSQCAREWLRLLENTNVSGPITALASNLVTAYVQYLSACDDLKAGLMDLQPGHFLNMPPSSKQEFVNFCPLPMPNSTQKRHILSFHQDHALFSEFERRYLQFRNDYIFPFYTKCFRRANVQVVLLDVLQILNWGMGSYNDHRRCIEGVLGRFKYGSIRKFIRPLRPLSKHLPTFLSLEKIEKTIFVATKADHAIPGYHENLTQLVADLVDKVQQAILGPNANAKIIKTYISSIRSTESFSDENKEDIRLRGIVLGHQDKGLADWRARPVPPKFPSEDAWKPDDYRSYSFLPIKFPSKEGTPVPHINLDQLLGHILQDYL